MGSAAAASVLTLRPVEAPRIVTRPAPAPVDQVEVDPVQNVSEPPAPRAQLSDEEVDAIIAKRRAPARDFLAARPGRLYCAAQAARYLRVKEATADELLMDCVGAGEADAFARGGRWLYAAPGTVRTTERAPAPERVVELVLSYLQGRPYFYTAGMLAVLLHEPQAQIARALEELREEHLDMRIEGGGSPEYARRLDLEKAADREAHRARLRHDLEEAEMDHRHAVHERRRQGGLRDFALRCVGSKLPDPDRQLGARGALLRLLQARDPGLLNVARYAHVEGGRRGLVPEGYAIEEWMIDAIFERSYWTVHNILGFGNVPRWRGAVEWHSDGQGEGAEDQRGLYLEP